MHHNLEISIKIQKGQFHTYFIKVHGKIHQNEKGLLQCPDIQNG